ncbi:DUF302 domain-containing protein [Neptuniibacter sp.]|uniref:DUF302 domain-containing protein n=1 Tax=Neptuniibacter sp. TaxID=1962643 RepID=UPI00262EFC4C|nr:DUF302 domain-containing protein [Neptuniibacter sp.]MCP4598658.1 DUF302 domain-containing protein [Neptuniibacter sp.]
MNSLRKYLLQISSILTLCFVTVLVQASPVLKLKLEGDFSSNYDKVSQALENKRFYVVFEPNIGGSISNFKERWGDDYNRNGFEEIRSLVFCNPWYVNQVINKDPEMAALCPLSVTLLHKQNTTQLMFLRPSQLKPDSPAQDILQELESDIEKALRESGAK